MSTWFVRGDVLLGVERDGTPVGADDDGVHRGEDISHLVSEVRVTEVDDE